MNAFRAAALSLVLSPVLALAQATDTGGPVKVGPGGAPGATSAAGPSWAMPLMMVGMFGFMYLFLIRPQAKRQKEHQNFLKELTPGTEIITSGGLVGRISQVTDTIVTVDLGSSTVRVLKSAITGKLDTSTAVAVPAKA